MAFCCRLTPVFSSNARVLESALVVGGYEIPAGIPINMSVWTAGRSDANFKEALTVCVFLLICSLTTLAIHVCGGRASNHVAVFI